MLALAVLPLARSAEVFFPFLPKQRRTSTSGAYLFPLDQYLLDRRVYCGSTRLPEGTGGLVPPKNSRIFGFFPNWSWPSQEALGKLGKEGRTQRLPWSGS